MALLLQYSLKWPELEPRGQQKQQSTTFYTENHNSRNILPVAVLLRVSYFNDVVTSGTVC